MNDEYKSAAVDTAPVIEPGHTFGTVTEKISAIVLTRPASNGWFIGFGIAFMMTMMMLFAIGYLFVKGVGIWGVTIPIGWGFAIVNFVWWIGIGHAGTLISAILLLLRQPWRNSINRFAEAMTLFAVAAAGIFPAIHVGRPWLAYWLFPYPSSMGVWPQFRSPLMWDVFAVSTYATISALFWFIGLVPDLATLRDRTDNKALKIVYGMFSLGWRGSARHWHRYETMYLLLAGLATPLVLSVHTVVSFDFAIGIVPGWHTTIFPPYFVAGAIYSGFAMVLMLAIPIRKIYGLEDFITDRHLQNSAKVMLATGLIVAYGYGIEAFMGWYGGDRYDAFTLWNRLHGPYAIPYWMLLICNIFVPQVLWIRKLRTSPLALFFISGVILVGMWLERFIIVVVSLSRDFLNSSWGMYYPTRWDWMIYIGTIGMFLMLMFLFLRILPAISIFEMRTLLPESVVKEGGEMKRDPIYGIMAEFDTAQHLIDAARTTHQAGYKKIDAYSPFPIEGLAEEIGFDHDEVPLVVLIGGIVGGLSGYLMQYWMSAVDYPLNIGGKPPHSWPAFIVITFEMTILFAGISAVFGMLALNGLPMPYHPVFNVPRFSSASKDRFFLIVFSSDKKYDPAATRQFLEGLAPRSVSEVPS